MFTAPIGVEKEGIDNLTENILQISIEVTGEGEIRLGFSC